VIRIFSGASADEVWQRAIAAFRARDGVRAQPSRTGETLELLHSVMEIQDPRQRWVAARDPAINPAFAVAEVIWILRGRNDAAFLNWWNRSLPLFAGGDAEYHGAYGARLQHSFGFNQLEAAWRALAADPESRQVVLQIWDPRVDFPGSDGLPRAPDIPCNVCAIPKVRDGRLEWLQVLRSNDLFLGVPYNFIQFTTLQEVMAGWLGLEPGTYVQVADSLHVYERDLEAALAPTAQGSALNDDTLAMPWEESLHWWCFLEEQTEKLMSRDVSPPEVDKILSQSPPRAIQHLLCLLAAEAARRHGWHELGQEFAARCANPAIQAAWNRWAMRMSRGRAGSV
jgi:thymidylate synthase